MGIIKYPKVHAALMDGRRIKFEGLQFFIRRGTTEPGQGEITYHLNFYLRDGEPPYEVLDASIPEDWSHDDAIDYLIEKAISHLSK